MKCAESESDGKIMKCLLVVELFSKVVPEDVVVAKYLRRSTMV